MTEKEITISPIPKTSNQDRLSTSTTFSSPLFPLLEEKQKSNMEKKIKMRFNNDGAIGGILGNLACITNQDSLEDDNVASSSSSSSCSDDSTNDESSKCSSSSTESEIEVVIPEKMINDTDDSFNVDDESSESDDNLVADDSDSEGDESITDDEEEAEETFNELDYDDSATESEEEHGEERNDDTENESDSESEQEGESSNPYRSPIIKTKKQASPVNKNSLHNDNTPTESNSNIDDDIEVEVLEITSEDITHTPLNVSEIISIDNSNINKTKNKTKKSSPKLNQSMYTPIKQARQNDIETSPFYSPLKEIKEQQNIESSNTSLQPPLLQQSAVIKQSVIKPGKWSLGTKIGSGSFGVVHMGMNDISGQILAIKRIPYLPTKGSKHYKELQHEIDLMKTLKHPNIVQYLGCEISSKEFYIFQEWVPGGCLSSLLKKFGCFSIQVIRSYLYQILLGLQYLHDGCNICHRDIKGGNILVDNAGVVKLADFGASKQILCKQTDEDDDMMLSMSMRGTPYFMAPEVLDGKYGTKADIWSVGGVIIQMLTCQAPWKSLGFTNPTALFCHVKSTNQIPPLSITVNSSLKCIIDNCFERDISKRKSAKLLLQDSFFNESDDDDDDVMKEIKSPLTKKERKKSKQPKKEEVVQKHWPSWAKESYKNHEQKHKFEKAIQDAINDLSICDDDKENSMLRDNPYRSVK